jgi:hypothetical protein
MLQVSKVVLVVAEGNTLLGNVKHNPLDMCVCEDIKLYTRIFTLYFI